MTLAKKVIAISEASKKSHFLPSVDPQVLDEMTASTIFEGLNILERNPIEAIDEIASMEGYYVTEFLGRKAHKNTRNGIVRYVKRIDAKIDDPKTFKEFLKAINICFPLGQSVQDCAHGNSFSEIAEKYGQFVGHNIHNPHGDPECLYSGDGEFSWKNASGKYSIAVDEYDTNSVNAHCEIVIEMAVAIHTEYYSTCVFDSFRQGSSAPSWIFHDGLEKIGFDLEEK